ncbi:TPA: hypothetical protein M2Q89_004753 [Escherichia coli]|nr:hypothetical protein [Escherichia coli]
MAGIFQEKNCRSHAAEVKKLAFVNCYLHGQKDGHGHRLSPLRLTTEFFRVNISAEEKKVKKTFSQV